MENGVFKETTIVETLRLRYFQVLVAPDPEIARQDLGLGDGKLAQATIYWRKVPNNNGVTQVKQFKTEASARNWVAKQTDPDNKEPLDMSRQ
jgi:hypothetical protein